MFDGITSAWATLWATPLLGLFLLAGVTLGVIALFSGRDWLESIFGLFRVFLTIFTTPFIFLRDALATVRNAGESEQHYARTRVFTLFRYSRIQYMGIFIGALLLLCAGITTALLAVYPSAEFEQQRILREQITQIESDLTGANQAAAAAASPQNRTNLANARTQAQTAYETQLQGNAAFLNNEPFFRNSPIVEQLVVARSAESVQRTRSRIESYLYGCPGAYNWRGYTPDDCTRFRMFANQLADRREAEFNLRQAAGDADAAFQNASNAASQAGARVTFLQERLAGTRQQLAAVSFTNPYVLMARLGGALAILFSTLLAVVSFVWIGAILVDVLNWLILMMRALEKTQSEKLEGPPSEENEMAR